MGFNERDMVGSSGGSRRDKGREQGMSEHTPYRAEGDQVFKNPVTTHNADGSRSITVGFPVCTVSEWVKNGAENIAGLLSQGETASETAAERDRLKEQVEMMREALREAADKLNVFGYNFPRGSDDETAAWRARDMCSAALAATEATDNG